MWFRFQIGVECHYCNNGWYVPAENWIFYECPSCMGVWLGCGCGKGLVAVPREQLRSGEWVTFSAADERGCVRITNLSYHDSEEQAISDGYPW